MEIECTQRLECTQEQHDTRYEGANLEHVGYLGICGKKYMVSKGPNKIGRDPQSCSIVLDLNSISRHHAVINVLNMNEFMLMDLDSVNKTKVQGNTLQPYIPHPLKNCDMVQFGEVFGVFRLLEEADDLPMTQAIDVPSTPVLAKHASKCGAPSVLIPESPEVSDKDDSFIMPSQPIQTSHFRSPMNRFLKPSNKIIAIQPIGSKKIDNAYWHTGKKSDSFHLDDSGSTFNDSTTISNGSNKVIDESIENIHEMETQEPFKMNESTDSIYMADTQPPSATLAIHFMETQQPLPDIHGSETQQPDIHSLNTQNIYNCETQAPDDISEMQKYNEEEQVQSDDKENVYDNGIFGAETQVFLVEKEEVVVDPKEKGDVIEPKEKDDLIEPKKDVLIETLKENFVIDPKKEDCAGEPSKTAHNRSSHETAIVKNDSDEEIFFDDINSQSIEEAFESQQLLPTELSPQIDRIENIKITSKSLKLTNTSDCENFDILPTQKITFDADMLPKQSILKDIDILPTQKINYNDEDLTDCEDDVSEKVRKPESSEINFEDMATQILGDDEIEAELPRYKDQTDGTSKETSFEDMPTQIIMENSREDNVEEMPTQIITEEASNDTDNVLITEVYSEEIISPFKIPLSTPMKMKKHSSLALTKSTSPITAEIKHADVDNSNYYLATQDIFNDLCSQKEPSSNDHKEETMKLNGENNDNDLVPCSVEEYPITDRFKDIEIDLSPSKSSTSIDKYKTMDQKTRSVTSKLQVPIENSNTDVMKTPKIFKIINTDLPDSQEIKIGVTLNHNSFTESSSDTEVEEISDHDSEITFGKKKKKLKINAKLNLTKKFEESLPSRIITRIRKPTYKIQSSDESTKNLCRSILKNSLLGDSEENIDTEIISENITRLKNKHSKKREKDASKSVESKKKPESRNENKKSETSKEDSKDHSKSRSSRSKSKKSAETKSNDRGHDDSDGEKKVRSTRRSRNKKENDVKNDKSKHDRDKRTDSKDKDRSDSKSRSGPSKSGEAKPKDDKRRVKTESSPEMEIRRSKRHKASEEKKKDTFNHENSTVYSVSSESGTESPKALKRPACGELEVPNPKRTRSLPDSRSSSVCASAPRAPLTSVHRVLFTAFSNDDVKNKLENLGAVLVTDVLQCTVLVTLQIKRTFKLLCAVGLGRPVVGPEWVQACADTNSIVDPWQYIVKDVQAEKRFRFNMEKTLRGKRNFLQGYNVSSTPSVLPSAQEMKLIVECSGGAWREGGRNWVVVSSGADRALWPALRRRGARLVSSEFVLGGALRQRADPAAAALRPSAAEKKEGEFVCGECGRRCLSRIGLSSHARAHTRS